MIKEILPLLYIEGSRRKRRPGQKASGENTLPLVSMAYQRVGGISVRLRRNYTANECVAVFCPLLMHLDLAYQQYDF